MNNIDTQNKDAVIDNWNVVENMSTTPGSFYPESYVFDENMSVKWNKEEVKRRNEEIRKTNESLREKKSHLRTEARNMIVEYLFYYADEMIKKEVLKKLFEHVSGDNSNEHVSYSIQECEDYIDIFLERYKY